MQMLFESSSEFGFNNGLNLIEGKVKKLNVENNKTNLKLLPHIGWNSLICENKEYKIFDKVCQYFVHSYAAFEVPKNNVIFQCNYSGINFVAGVKKET